MEKFRSEPMTEYAGSKVLRAWDVSAGTIKDIDSGKVTELDLPKSNVLRFDLENNGWFAIRPSGTEPKIKFYFGVCEDGVDAANAKLEKYKAEIEKML